MTGVAEPELDGVRVADCVVVGDGERVGDVVLVADLVLVNDVDVVIVGDGERRMATLRLRTVAFATPASLASQEYTDSSAPLA